MSPNNPPPPPTPPLPSLRLLRARLGNRSVFILDPLQTPTHQQSLASSFTRAACSVECFTLAFPESLIDL